MTVTITNNIKSFPGHTLGEWRNSYAFAIIKDNGSVVTWGGAYFDALLTYNNVGLINGF